MLLFSFTIATFLFALLLHIIIWRIKIPRKQTEVLLLIFIIAFVLGVFFLYRMALPVQINLWRIYLEASLFYVSLVIAYLLTYSAIAALSPSLLICDIISRSKIHGVTKSELELRLDDELLIKPRIEELVNDNMVCYSDNKYRLTMKGLLIVLFFVFFRNTLRAPKGG